ncbi:hypothetical protein [Vibrio sp. D431a]|uniref:hypothetical protein n=1 Tax=Vibrio sp. D431a TaxID=2837388 RepID=UPI0025572B16|nr:hypothetical protein [Vibrio sp. D431a]MDK9790635.1 hypothetical protein [Vibrio sp. D431a]
MIKNLKPKLFTTAIISGFTIVAPMSVFAKSINTPIEFFIDKEVLSDYTKDEVYKKVFSLVEHNNEALRETGIRRTVSSIEFLESKNSFKDPELELHALLSKRENHANVFKLFFEDKLPYDTLRAQKKRSSTKYPAYRVFMGLQRKPVNSCGAAPEPTKDYTLPDSERVAVLSFDIHGQCSAEWLLAHELGHIDGLKHISNKCNNNSMNIMAPSIDRSERLFFAGDTSCIGANNDYIIKYKQLGDDLDKYSVRKKPLNFHNIDQPYTTDNIRFVSDSKSTLSLLFDIRHNSRITKRVFPKISYLSYKDGYIVRKITKLHPVTLSPRRKVQTVVVEFSDNDLAQAFLSLEKGEGSIIF